MASPNIGSGGSPVRTVSFGNLLLERAFTWKDLFSITCELWIGGPAHVPVFSRVGGDEMNQMKVKVLSLFLDLIVNFS